MITIEQLIEAGLRTVQDERREDEQAAITVLREKYGGLVRVRYGHWPLIENGKLVVGKKGKPMATIRIFHPDFFQHRGYDFYLSYLTTADLEDEANTSSQLVIRGAFDMRTSTFQAAN